MLVQKHMIVYALSMALIGGIGRGWEEEDSTPSLKFTQLSNNFLNKYDTENSYVGMHG